MSEHERQQCAHAYEGIYRLARVHSIRNVDASRRLTSSRRDAVYNSSERGFDVSRGRVPLLR